MTRAAGLPLGRIAGAPVTLAPSWALIAAVVVVLFGPAVQRALPSLGGWSWVVAAAYAVVLALSVLVHEAAHALVGRAQGQRPERIELTLWGGHTRFVGLHAGPWGSLATALAGPGANLVVAGAAWFVGEGVTGLTGQTGAVAGLLLEAAVWANLLLAAFNVLPGLPLDGGRLVESIVWAATGDRDRGTTAAGHAGRVVAVAVAVVWLLPALRRGAVPDLLTAALALAVAGTLWQGAGQAVAAGRAGRRLSALSLDALARPAAAVPATAPLAAALRARDAGREPVVVDAAGRPLGLLDDAALALGARADGPGPVPAASVTRVLAPGAVLPRTRLPAAGPALLEALAAAERSSPPGPAWVLVDDDGRPLAVLARSAVLDALADPTDPDRPRRRTA